jgi:hypothetical protein
VFHRYYRIPTMLFWIQLIMLALITLLPTSGHASNSAIRVGALRWDAWYSTSSTSLGTFATKAISAKKYQLRLPACAKPASESTSVFNCDTQEVIDQEISYAKQAGIAFWAYDWFPQGNPMRRAWELHQQSRYANDMDWCVVEGYESFDHGAHNIPTYDTPMEFSQFFRWHNYEKQYRGRPLFFLLQGKGVSLHQLAIDISMLRLDADKIHVGNPYIVVMSPVPASAASDATTIGADAIASYNGTTPNASEGTYASLVARNEAFWNTQASTGMQTIPTAVTGWDRRPRIEMPVPWEQSYQKPGVGINNYYLMATPKAIASQVSAMLIWISHNPTIATSHEALIYAWNEFDEGGWLDPTYSPKGADHSRLDALSTVLR